MKVIRKQNNSEMCFICGVKNEFGLKAPFYEMEDQSVVSIFNYSDVHQSYPGRTHGGIISAMLDEIIGRAIWVYDPNCWGVTITLNIKYRKPVPYDCKLKAVGKITKNTSRLFQGNGYIYDMDGTLLAEGEATYMKLSLDSIASSDSHDACNVFVSDNVTEIN